MIPTTVRYLVVGVGLFALDFAITKALLEYAHQRLEIAQWCGRFAGALCGYWLHRYITFASKGSRPSQLRYWTIAVLLWSLSPLVLRYALAACDQNLLPAKVLTECVLVTASYLLLRYFVYKPAQPTAHDR